MPLNGFAAHERKIHPALIGRQAGAEHFPEMSAMGAFGRNAKDLGGMRIEQQDEAVAIDHDQALEDDIGQGLEDLRHQRRKRCSVNRGGTHMIPLHALMTAACHAFRMRPPDTVSGRQW